MERQEDRQPAGRERVRGAVHVEAPDRVGELVLRCDRRLPARLEPRDLVGAAIERYPSYSTRSTFTFLADASSQTIDLLPFMARLRILRQWNGICDMTPRLTADHGSEVANLILDAGWETWGFKATSIAGASIAKLICDREDPFPYRPLPARSVVRRTALSQNERRPARTHESNCSGRAKFQASSKHLFNTLRVEAERRRARRARAEGTHRARQIATLTGSVASHTTPRRNTAIPREKRISCSRRVPSFELMPAKKSAEAKRTTPST